MKKWLLSLILFNSVVCSAATTLNPMDFDGSEAQKKQVIESIIATVKKDYCGKIDMCEESTLRTLLNINSLEMSPLRYLHKFNQTEKTSLI